LTPALRECLITELAHPRGRPRVERLRGRSPPEVGRVPFRQHCDVDAFHSTHLLSILLTSLGRQPATRQSTDRNRASATWPLAMCAQQPRSVAKNRLCLSGPGTIAKLERERANRPDPRGTQRSCFCCVALRSLMACSDGWQVTLSRSL